MSHLTVEQRYSIKLLLNKNHTISFIANYWGRDKSVISREINRNGDKRNGKYSNILAQKKADERKREKRKSSSFNSAIEHRIRNLLKEDYSPESFA